MNTFIDHIEVQKLRTFIENSTRDSAHSSAILIVRILSEKHKRNIPGLGFLQRKLIKSYLKLLKDYRNNDQTVLSLLNYYEFHILPVANPDGYENSHTMTRFWRKNMVEYYELLAPCVGRDINRNFNFQWMVLNYLCF